jgi:hypothetical protein
MSLAIKEAYNEWYNRVYAKMRPVLSKITRRGNHLCPWCGNEPDKKIESHSFHQCSDCARRWPINLKPEHR